MEKNNKNKDTNPTLGELFSMSPVNNKPIEVSFTAPDLSSQGRLLLRLSTFKTYGLANRGAKFQTIGDKAISDLN